MKQALPFLVVGLCATVMVVGALLPWVSESPVPAPRPEMTQDSDWRPIITSGRWLDPLREPQYRDPTRWNGLSPAFLGRGILGLGLVAAVACAVFGVVAARGLAWTAQAGGRFLAAPLVLSLICTLIDVVKRRELMESEPWLRPDFGLMLTLGAATAATLLAFRSWPLPIRRKRRLAAAPPLEVFE